jgi:valyl-tRNA synthetase
LSSPSSVKLQLRLFAPFLPFVTEEVWSWWQTGSVHRAPWPSPDEISRVAGAGDGDAALLDTVGVALSRYLAVPLEAQAYALQARYQAAPDAPFDAEAEIRAEIEASGYQL